MKQQIIALSKVLTISPSIFKVIERLSQQFVCSFRTVATSCATLLQEFNSASISKRQTQLLWPFCLKIPIWRKCDLSSFQKCDTIIQTIRSNLTSYILSNTFTYLWLHFSEQGERGRVLAKLLLSSVTYQAIGSTDLARSVRQPLAQPCLSFTKVFIKCGLFCCF